MSGHLVCMACGHKQATHLASGPCMGFRRLGNRYCDCLIFVAAAHQENKESPDGN